MDCKECLAPERLLPCRSRHLLLQIYTPLEINEACARILTNAWLAHAGLTPLSTSVEGQVD
jgi:hypothetical protein